MRGKGRGDIPPYKFKNNPEWGEAYVRLSLNENFVPPPDRVIKAGYRAVNNIHRYPEIDGYSLRKKIADSLSLTPDMVFLSGGSILLIYTLLYAFASADGEVIAPKVSFAAYPAAVLASGARYMVFDNEGHWGMDPDKILKLVNEKTQVILLCSPNNPTGAIMTRKELLYLLSNIPSDVMVILDEAYYEYVENPDYHFDSHNLIAHYPNLVILRTFSKAYSLAGARIGYGIAVPKVWEIAGNFQPIYILNRTALAMAYEVYGDKDHIGRVRKLAKKRREYLIHHLSRLGFQIAGTPEANFVMAKPTCGKDASTLREELRHHKILVNETTMYGIPGWLRITVGAEKENEYLIETLEKLCSV